MSNSLNPDQRESNVWKEGEQAVCLLRQTPTETLQRFEERDSENGWRSRNLRPWHFLEFTALARPCEGIRAAIRVYNPCNPTVWKSNAQESNVQRIKRLIKSGLLRIGNKPGKLEQEGGCKQASQAYFSVLINSPGCPSSCITQGMIPLFIWSAPQATSLLPWCSLTIHFTIHLTIRRSIHLSIHLPFTYCLLSGLRERRPSSSEARRPRSVQWVACLVTLEDAAFSREKIPSSAQNSMNKIYSINLLAQKDT